MSVGAESIATDAWVGPRLDVVDLTDLLVGGVHEHPAPLNTAYPFVTWQVYGNPVVSRGIGPDARIMVTATYLVRVTALLGSTKFDAAARKVHDLMVDWQGPVTGGIILSTTATEEFRLDENLEGVTVRHVGGLYAIEAVTT